MTQRATRDRTPDSRTAGEHRGAIVDLLLDVGLPLVAYYALHALGTSDRTALLAATVVAGARLAAVAAWTRRVSLFAAVMLAVFGVSLALAVVAGDARFVLLKDSFTTALIGIAFLASLLSAQPLTLAGAREWSPQRARELDELYATEPAARRAFRTSALVWGLGLLAESALRVPLVYLLPVDVAVAASTASMIAAFIVLTAWNIVYVTAAVRRTPALTPLLPAHMRRRSARNRVRASGHHTEGST